MKQKKQAENKMSLNRDPKLIGGSDVAAICGESPWSNPLDVWLRMTGNQLTNKKPTNPMIWGIKKEALILNSIEEDFKFKFKHRANHKTEIVLEHPGKPYCISPDGFIPRYGEVKNVKAFKRKFYGREGTDEIEQQYLCQTQHGLGIMRDLGMDIKECHFRVLFGGDDPVDFFIKRDDSFIKTLRTIIDDFYNSYVVTNQEPPIDASDAYSGYLKDKFPVATIDKKIVTFSEAVQVLTTDETKIAFEAVQEAQTVSDQIKKLGEKLKLYKNIFAKMCTDNYGIEFFNGKFLNYNVSGRTSWKDVAESLAKEYLINESELKEIAENHRGRDSRTNRFYFND